MSLGTDEKKDGCKYKSRSGEAAASDAQSIDPSEPVAEGSSDQTADGDREEGKHGVAGAGIEVEAANLGHVGKEPTEEDPRYVAEAEVSEHEGGKIATAKDGTPGDMG